MSATIIPLRRPRPEARDGLSDGERRAASQVQSPNMALPPSRLDRILANLAAQQAEIRIVLAGLRNSTLRGHLGAGSLAAELEEMACEVLIEIDCLIHRGRHLATRETFEAEP